MRALRVVVVCLVLATSLSGCVAHAPAAPASQRATPPPWDAPRDAISYIEASGLRQVRLDATDHQHIVDVTITVDGTRVALAPYIGIDRVRAVQAPVHTHDASGEVWLEGEGTEEVTLGSFFTVWGVRFDDRCLGAACGTVRVTADGKAVAQPVSLHLRDVARVDVAVTSR